MGLNEKVLIAEDTKQFQKLAGIYLESEGHTVVERITSLEEWVGTKNRLKEMRVTVVVLDRQLGDTDKNGIGGVTILQDIKLSGLPIKTVGISSNTIPGVDVDVGKTNISSLGKVVTRL